MERCFTAEDAWHGGFYELAMQYGPHADQELEAGLQAIWQRPDLEGCYLQPGMEPSQQQRVSPSLMTQLADGHLRGIAALPNGHCVPCGTWVVREEGGDDWLGFYVPLGALEAACPVGAFPFMGAHPFEGPVSSREWREPLESWLANIGQSVFADAPFRLGLVGFEVSGFDRAEHLTASGAPAERWIGYLIPSLGRLGWHPTNQWQQQPKPVS